MYFLSAWWIIKKYFKFAILKISFCDFIKNIRKIDTETESVTDPAQIEEFVKNADAKMMSELQKKLQKLRLQGSSPPVKFKASEEEIKKGVPASYEVPVTFDTANFFV